MESVKLHAIPISSLVVFLNVLCLKNKDHAIEILNRRIVGTTKQKDGSDLSCLCTV